RENARLARLDADVEEGLRERLLSGPVDPALELGDLGVGSRPAAYCALGLVMDGDREAPQQIDPVEGVGRGFHLLLELVNAAGRPLLEEAGAEFADAREVGVEAPRGDAEPRTEIGDGERVGPAVGQQVE